MKPSYSLEDVAAAHLPADWKDGVRWLKRRIVSGEIPGRRLSRTVFRMTDEDIEAMLESRATQKVPPAQVETSEPVGLLDGLSQRSRNRLRSAS